MFGLNIIGEQLIAHSSFYLISQEPIFLDLIGTCHNFEHNPPLLKNIHLKYYRVHAARGLTFYSPQTISQLIK